jgi:hypothetical protein
MCSPLRIVFSPSIQHPQQKHVQPATENLDPLINPLIQQVILKTIPQPTMPQSTRVHFPDDIPTRHRLDQRHLNEVPKARFHAGTWGWTDHPDGSNEPDREDKYRGKYEDGEARYDGGESRFEREGRRQYGGEVRHDGGEARKNSGDDRYDGGESRYDREGSRYYGEDARYFRRYSGGRGL